MTKPLLSAKGISRGFQAGDETITVLDGVEVDIYPGELVAIMGASGSGKSTLMNILGCLDSPSTGTYAFDGQDVSEMDHDTLAALRREHFGFIFQRYQLLPELDSVGNVEVPAIYTGLTPGARRERAEELLRQLGLSTRLDHRPGELSGGQQQRVSVARALMNGGEVILTDEPTGALDTKSGAELIALLLELNRQGHTIVMVTHDPAVAKHARRIIEISDGRIISDSTNSEAEAAQTRAAPPALHGIGDRSPLRRLWEATRMSVHALLAHRVRSLLTMLGIIIGIASVVLVVALGQGSQEQVLEDISSLGTSTITVRSGSGFGARGSDGVETLAPSDAITLAAQPYAESVSPSVSTTSTVKYRSVSASASINGVTGDYFNVYAYTTTAGSLFNEEDVASYAQVAVIDADTSDTFFANGASPVGEVLMIGQVPVRVIGVAESSGTSFGPTSLNIWVPYTTAMARVSGQDHLDSIAVRVADDYDVDAAEAEIAATLLARHRTEDFFTANSDSIRDSITSTSKTLTTLVAMIAVISLIVGGIGVMNIMWSRSPSAQRRSVCESQSARGARTSSASS